MSHTLFISDLHLDENHSSSTSFFHDFMKNQAPYADALYILGDLFELWIGDDNLTPFNLEIMGILRKLTAHGTPIYFVPGNRDFLLGNRFAKKTGVQNLPELTVINLYGASVLLAHGDVFCTLDKQHMKFRKISQNKFLQYTALTLPLIMRRKLGNLIRNQSRIHTKLTPLTIQDVTQDVVIDIMRNHRVNYLVHGHTHRPLARDLIIDRVVCERIVLGSWERQGCVLKWSHNGNKEMIFFK